ncbi:hypothetical protein PENARI_c001G04233 [Penicillium arizonense]|uniref:Uncharacterized protein n=1 Tax=Penicillium arizonense TaxID=1835702 RepID=A0A1F5LYM8_PENAI|nr:hypothetical protein PENARI_c001G04233 [Penicillium arizonense]OGE58262.1 hypothetical protein PENARI_c001G04233 [Penicillium arizonense]
MAQAAADRQGAQTGKIADIPTLQKIQLSLFMSTSSESSESWA